jgi:hypothetical protein
VLGLIAADPHCPERAVELIIAAELRQVARRTLSRDSILGPTVH